MQTPFQPMRLKSLWCAWLTWCFCTDISQASVRKFNITKEAVAAIWQSSSAEGLFGLEPAACGRLPVTDGCHGLLLKLENEVRVLSVTVHAGESAQASHFNVLVSSWFPLENLTDASSRRSDLIWYNSSYFSRCDRTPGSSGSALLPKYHCNQKNIPLPWEYILIRNCAATADAGNAIKFDWIEIEEEINAADFTDARAGQTAILKHLIDNDAVILNASLSFPLDADSQPSCHIGSQAGEQWNVSVQIHNKKRMSFIVKFTATHQLFNWVLMCTFNCQNQCRSAAVRLKFQVKAKDLRINLSFGTQQKYWVVGHLASFNATIEGGFPEEVPTCKICDRTAPGSDNCLEGSTIGIELRRIHAAYKSTATCRFCPKVVFKFSMNVTQSLENRWIFCDSQVAKKGQNIPSIIHPCKTRIILSPKNHWMEGATVRVALVSFSSYWPSKASYQCVLRSALSDSRRTSIAEISLTPNTSAVFSAKVNRSWGSSVFIRCLSNRPELQCKEKEIRASTSISVFYKAEATIEPLSQPLCSGSTAYFRLSFIQHGNPPARFGDCTISGRLLQSSDTGNNQRMIELTSDDSGQFISCRMLQNFSGDKDDVSYFNSSSLHVEEKPVSTWTANHPLAVWEGEVLSVNVSSVGGSPVSISHECWLLLGLKSTSLQRISHPEGTTEFNAKVDKSMHGSVLTCTVTHPCFNQSEQHFAQNVSVFYSPVVEFTTINNNIVSVSVSEGKPQPKVVCWKALSENFDGSESTVVEEVRAESRKYFVITQKDCLGTTRVWISCRVNQAVFTKKVLNYPKHLVICERDRNDCGKMLPILCMVVVAVAFTVSMPVTVYIWRRNGSPPSGTQRPQGAPTAQRPPELPLVSVAAGRDPNTVYYEENPSLPDRPPIIAERNPIAVYYSEEVPGLA